MRAGLDKALIMLLFYFRLSFKSTRIWGLTDNFYGNITVLKIRVNGDELTIS